MNLILTNIILISLLSCTLSNRNFRGLASKSTSIRPWQVMSTKGEIIISDVFYADDIQNDQAMNLDVIIPTSDGKSKFKYGINSLIYPTLGNPKLYIKPDQQDEMMAVLRINHEWMESFIASKERIKKTQDFLVEFKEGKNPFQLFLSKRDKKTRSLVELGRQDDVEKPNIHKISPERVIIKTQKSVPMELREKDTVIIYFSKKSMDVESGLYDLSVSFDDNFKESEIQYNSVKLFESFPEEGKYSILNISDSQASYVDHVLGALNFKDLTLDKLKVFTLYLKKVYEKSPDELKINEKRIVKASFITFNGDLHNGGQPTTLGIREVAETYNKEAQRITEILRELPMPIFLTIGNHDGYASMGHMPGANKKKYEKLYKIVDQSYPHDDYPDRKIVEKKIDLLRSSISKTLNRPGGEPVDIFYGKYIRRSGAQNIKKHWKRMADDKNNYPLQDGFYQWRKTYGPLNSSWVFGDNYYLNINSFDIRQYRRTGWGMYTVNYGGNVSGFQGDWMRQVLSLAKGMGKDVILNSHHDPRGGHYGKDYPYYFKQVEFRGMAESFKNYVKGEILNPQFCKLVPDWGKSDKAKLDCIHDGLQEWMRPDPYFDCLNEHLLEEGSEYYLEGGKKTFITRHQKVSGKEILYLEKEAPEVGKCNIDLFKPSKANEKFHPYYSGFAIIHRIATSEINTMLLGHTHYNNLEVEQPEVLTISFNKKKKEYFFKYFKKNALDRMKEDLSKIGENAFQSEDILYAQIEVSLLKYKTLRTKFITRDKVYRKIVRDVLTITKTENKLVPELLLLDSSSLSKYSKLDASSPIRAHNKYRKEKKWYKFGKKLNVKKYKKEINKTLLEAGIKKDDKNFFKILFEAAGHNFNKSLKSELVVARVTTMADLSSQRIFSTGASMFGFTIMDF